MLGGWKLTRWFGIFICLYWLGQGPAVPAQTEEEKDVRKIAEQACKASFARDSEAFMKVADVPWWHWMGEDDKNQVFKKREDLQKYIKDLFADPMKAPAGVQALSVGKLVPLKKAKLNVSINDEKLLKQVVGPDDWVARINMKIDGNDCPGGQYFIRRRNGQWKVVGFNSRD